MVMAPASKTDITHLDVRIRQFEPRDQQQVAQLFAAGMLFYVDQSVDTIPNAREFGQAYVQQCLEDDLAAIEQVYQRAGGNFWVATVHSDLSDNSNSSDSDEEKVVAMVGLQAKDDGSGELRRMAVDPAYHRFGLGRKLVAHLESWAKTSGFTSVRLSTGSILTSACKFYPSIGYKHTKTVESDEEPRIKALFFAKTL